MNILLDLDGTLLDLKSSIIDTYDKLCYHFKIKNPSVENAEEFFKFRVKYWQNYEAVKHTKAPADEVRAKLFIQWFKTKNITIDKNQSKEISEYFNTLIENNPFVIEGADELLIYLSSFNNVYIATNGDEVLAYNRIKKLGWQKYIAAVFGSSNSLVKPDKKYYNEIFSKLGNKNKKDYICIGDTLNTDIRGANNVGIDSIYVKVRSEKFASSDERPTPTYTVKTLAEIKNIIKKE